MKIILSDSDFNSFSVLFLTLMRAVMEKWVGKIAVVTGASAGIGAEIVRDFAKAGIHVIGLARRPQKIEEIAIELGETPGKIHSYKCDVSDSKSIKQAFQWIEEKFSFVHILINNAGCGFSESIFTDTLQDGEHFDKVINTNFNGLVHMCRHVYHLMIKSDDYGMIINMNSIAGHIVPYSIEESVANVYHGSKHAVTATTEVMVS